MSSAAYSIDYVERYEIIEGVKNIMSPSPGWIHADVDSNLITIFKNYCRKNNCGKVFGDNIDVHLPDGSLFMPDLSIVCDRKILKDGGTIYGVPDLIVEILSKSTAKKDFGKKKDAYERNGVKEYWIVNPIDKSIQVYHLIDRKFNLDYIYHIFEEVDLELLTEKEREEIKTQIKVSIFDDLLVEVSDVFYDI